MSFDDEHTEAAVVAALAVSSVTPRDLDPTKIQGVQIPNSGDYHVIDLEHLADHPRRKKGRVVLHDGKSFSTYVNKHEIDAVTMLYADVTHQSVIAVINDDGAEGEDPGWRDHRAVLELKHTEAWDVWMAINGKMLTQVEFAEHIESNAPDIVEPDAATMLELAQTFQAKKDVEFKSSRMLDSGQRQLTYHEQQTAAAGANGTIEIPAQLTLGVAPFEIGEHYRITARFRYRLIEGELRLGVKLDSPDEILRTAFKDVVTEIQGLTGTDLLYGTPPA